MSDRPSMLTSCRPHRWRIARRMPTAPVALVLLMMSFGAAALGEYDGIWAGRESASAQGQTESGTSGTIIHQTSATTLDMFTETDQRSVTLRGSGRNWSLPGPINTTILGYPVRLDSLSLTFQNTSRFTGTYGGVVQGIRFTGSFDYRRQPCQVIPIPYTSGPLSGGEDSVACFEINVPAGALALRASTSGGSGDADLAAAYHKRDFRYATSDYWDNQESVFLSAPEPGKWFVAVIGWDSFSGVTLTVTLDLPPPPVPAFSVSPGTGMAPLSVQFLDGSSGSINQWHWTFGDGSTSALRNPRHTYTEPGRYDVSLRVTGAGGSRSLARSGAVRVNGPGVMAPILQMLLDDSP